MSVVIDMLCPQRGPAHLPLDEAGQDRTSEELLQAKILELETLKKRLDAVKEKMDPTEFTTVFRESGHVDRVDTVQKKLDAYLETYPEEKRTHLWAGKLDVEAQKFARAAGMPETTPSEEVVAMCADRSKIKEVVRRLSSPTKTGEGVDLSRTATPSDDLSEFDVVSVAEVEEVTYRVRRPRAICR